MYFTHLISAITAMFGLMVCAIGARFTQIQEDGVRFASQSIIGLSVLVFHCTFSPERHKR